MYACILAGARKEKYIDGQPKCFLRMPNGQSPIMEVLLQTYKITDIKKIIIIAPQKGLNNLKKQMTDKLMKQKVLLIPQAGSQQANIVKAKKELENHLKKKQKNLGLLYLFGDTPFRKQCSIEEFIKQIKEKKADLIISYAEEHIIRPYYPFFKKPLIPFMVNNSPTRYKEANMFYFNPDKMIPELADKFYQQRHTGRITTMIKLIRLIHQIGGSRAMHILLTGFFVRQWHRTFRRFTPKSFHSPKIFYRPLRIEKLLPEAYKFFGVKIDFAFSSFPDGYIDVDTKLDYNKTYRLFFEINQSIARDCAVIQARQRLLAPLKHF